ncbi:MAG: YjhG/YagF family D-xylonate dehydratase [Planctomycetes bacterium]|jgi:putative YjhG/YagF family dehydratase|nr:YjhG/YagF family D-xylonate dehydratase [Planctomycetota bacterium]
MADASTTDDFWGRDEGLYDLATTAPGPAGELPLSTEILTHAPSGDVFGLIQDAGMGWPPSQVLADAFLLLSHQGGLRGADGRPIALGYHVGHYELGLLVEAAAREFHALGCMPFAGYCTDPCDGRTQGTPGMMDSLAYRNEAASVFRRLIRSLPGRKGVLGIATCDKSLPAIMMALASMHELPVAVVPGGVTLPPAHGEDLGTIQSIGARFAQGEVTLDYARQMTCRACAGAGGGCQFLGTAATSQVVAEALGLTVPHAALAPSGQKIWLDVARRSARALRRLSQQGLTVRHILTAASIRNAMTVFAAFGGSTNLLLHIPAIAYAAELDRPTVADWNAVNRRTPRLVDVLPNGPRGHPTVRAYLAGGVPEVMLHLRALGLLNLDAFTITGARLGQVLESWEHSERRRRLREILRQRDGIDPDDVILPPSRARERGLTGTITLPQGNLAPEGAVIKSTAIDPTLLDVDGVYRKVGPARIVIGERAGIQAIRQGDVHPGEILAVICAGPLGSGMEETLEVTGALKNLSWGKHVAVLTDGRFSGVSTGACIGHVGPEALAGGPLGKLRDGDVVQIVIDCRRLEGSVDLIGEADTPAENRSPNLGSRLLAQRPLRSDLAAYTDLPDDTRLWAALQDISGGTWAGCVFDTQRILRTLEAGRRNSQGDL